MEHGADAPIGKELKAALTLIETITLHPDDLGSDDIRSARSAGLTDQAIEDALNVAVLFNVQDRLADSLGWRVPKRLIEKSAPYLLRLGYRILTFA